MKEKEREDQSKVVGVVSTVLFHSFLLLAFAVMSFQVKTPPPPEMLIEMTFDEEDFIERIPRRPRVDVYSEQAAAPSRETDPRVRPAASEPVSQSSQQTKASAPSSLDEVGDIETVKEPNPINPRSLYSSRDVGEQAADNTGKVDERALYRGGVEGNSDYSAGSSPDNGSSFSLTGRSTVGSLPRPVYNENTQGSVVVEITVDQQGNVTSAVPGAKGTTTQDSRLWEAARAAAMKARFNVDMKAAAVQTGTITYIFRLE